MKTVATLIKLHKRTLDELRRKLTQLESQKSELEAAIKKLHQDLQNEQELAKTQIEMSGFFGDFAKRIQKRQMEIVQEILAVDKKITAVREEVNVAFSELKKFEIAEANAKRRKDAEERRKETIRFDEIAGQQHNRKKNETA